MHKTRKKERFLNNIWNSYVKTSTLAALSFSSLRKLRLRIKKYDDVTRKTHSEFVLQKRNQRSKKMLLLLGVKSYNTIHCNYYIV